MLEPVARCWTPAVARQIAELRADPATQAHLDALAAKCNAGELSDAEQREYEAYVDVLDLIGLADRARDRVGRFSGGMKRRLNFGCGVVHSPQVLLLNEPTAGIDPQSRVRLLDLVREQVRGGATVLYTDTWAIRIASFTTRELGSYPSGETTVIGTPSFAAP